MGYVEKRKDRYRGIFRHPITGRRVSETFEYRYEAEGWVVVAEGRAVAAAKLAETEELVAEPAPPKAGPAEPTLTVAEHTRNLIERRSGRLADATRRGYEVIGRAYDETGLGDRPLATLRRSDVEAWITRQVRAEVGKATINARLKLLRMVTKDAKAELLIEHDPAAAVDYLTTDLKADRVLTRLEESRLLAHATPELAAAVLIALDCGLRWSEVYGLTTDSISGPYLTVRQINERTTRKIRRYPKGHRERIVPLATSRVRATVETLVADAYAREGAGALLFTSHTGALVSYESWRKLRWTPTVDAAGLDAPRPGFHTLRHTYGTRLAAAGVPRSEIAKLMGHADEETTARYIHAGDDGRRMDLAAAALEAPPALAVVSA